MRRKSGEKPTEQLYISTYLSIRQFKWRSIFPNHVHLCVHDDDLMTQTKQNKQTFMLHESVYISNDSHCDSIN